MGKTKIRANYESQDSKKRLKRKDIQVLRGLAVLAVILFHAKEAYFPLGYLGVDVFFVISGVVITPLLVEIFQGNNISIELRAFFERRFYRLAPALGTTLTASAIVIFLFGNLGDLRRFASQGIYSLLLIGNFGALKFSGNYFSSNPNPLIHTWSLSVEEQIYILLPAAMLFIKWKSKRDFTTVWKKLFLLLFSLSLVLYVAPHLLLFFGNKGFKTANLDFFFYFSLSRLWEFIAGSFVYLLSSNFHFRNRKLVKLLHISTVICISTILVSRANWSISIITPIVVMLTVLHLWCNENSNENKASKWLAWVGDRSYSIYLVHMPLIYLAKYSPGLGSGRFQKILVLTMMLASILLGNLQFNFIEKKFRMGVRRSGYTPRKLLIESLIFSIGIPLLLFGLILGWMQMNFKDSHLLSRAGCVDKVFNPLKCSWNVQPSAGSILLVGDSQAYAAADGVQLAANRLRLNFLGVSASGCPFLQADTTGSKPINCLKFQSSVLQYIEINKPKFVMIANRTTGYLDPASGWLTFVDPSGEPAKDKAQAAGIYSQKLLEVSSELKAQGIKVIIFQDIPERILIRNPQSNFEKIFLRNDFKQKSTARVVLNSTARKIEASLAKAGLVSLYDPSLELCGNSCNRPINVAGIYLDNWHLSTTGSLRLADSIEKLLRKES